MNYTVKKKKKKKKKNKEKYIKFKERKKINNLISYKLFI